MDNRFKSGREQEDSDVFAVCVDLIVPGFGTIYIAVFEDNGGAKNLAQNPVCTSTSKHIDVRAPVLREFFGGENIFCYSSLRFSAVQHPAATCATHFVVHGGGGMLFAVQCAEYD